MTMTPQERLALGVAALLLAGGATVRVLRTEPVPAELVGAPAAEAPASRLAAQVEDSVKRAARRRAPLAEGERIDPNTASADELDRLPRVGPALARRIVDWRAGHGAFRSLADFDSVPGVGPSLLRVAGPHLALAAAPAAPFSARDPAPAASSIAELEPSVGGSRAAAPGEVVDVNHAATEALATLPGIGPALAGRIVAWRGEHGPFATVDELRKVPGIGPATVERLRSRVRAGP